MLNKKLKKSWRHKEWFEFADKVKQRDNYKCLKCERGEHEVILQVHHEVYRDEKAPWEYALSDCVTLCRGCHAREHNLIEPDRGWHLLAIDDLGDLDGICERVNCNTPIRYEHLTYHPNWGYKIVGSTCINHLTEKDQELSSKILNIYKGVTKFINKSVWEAEYIFGRKCIEAKYKHHIIRIYGEDKNHSYKIGIKEKGYRGYDYTKEYKLKNRGLEEVQEFAFIAVNGIICENYEERKVLKNIYKCLLKIK